MSMEINGLPNSHEHATLSLKILLLVFAVVLLGALSYLVWAQNTAPDTTDYSATKSTTTATSPATTTTTKKSTPPASTKPATDPCKDKKSYTIPLEKLTVCYPTSWAGDLTAGDSSFSFRHLAGAAGGSANFDNLSVAIVKSSPVSSYEYEVLDSFILNGKTVYLMSPVGGDAVSDEGNRLSGCSGSKLCDIPAKNTPGSFLEVKGSRTTMISPAKTYPLTSGSGIIEIIKSLHY